MTGARPTARRGVLPPVFGSNDAVCCIFLLSLLAKFGSCRHFLEKLIHDHVIKEL